MAASTSRHFPDSCAAASAFSRARSSRMLGATLIWAIAAVGLPARSSAMILTGQEDELLTEFFADTVKGALSALALWNDRIMPQAPQTSFDTLPLAPAALDNLRTECHVASRA